LDRFEASPKQYAGSYYNTIVRVCGTFQLVGSLRRGTPMVRLTNGCSATPCCRAARPKIWVMLTSRAGDSVRGR